jgi:hypothetical protein
MPLFKKGTLGYEIKRKRQFLIDSQETNTKPFFQKNVFPRFIY